MQTDRIVYTRRTVPTTSPDDHPGVRLRLAREWRGLTQLQLAESAAVDEQTVWRTEKMGSLSKKAVQGYVRALGCSAEWLLYGHGPSPQDLDLVDLYLRSRMGVDTPDDVAQMLRRVSYRSLGLRQLTLQGVHRVRELIQMNRLLGPTMGRGHDPEPDPKSPRR